MVPEMVGTIIYMVKMLFSLIKLSCMAALRGIFIVINTWVEILSASIYFHAKIFWRSIVCTVSFVALPARALAALQREKLLRVHVQELRSRLDTLELEKMQLQERFQIAIREYEMMEKMLGELEEEHEQAIHKIERLKIELQDLKDENHQLKEVHGKAFCDTDSVIFRRYDYGQKLKDNNIPDAGVFLLKCNHNKSAITLTDVRMNKDDFEEESKGNIDKHDYVKTGSGASNHQIIPGLSSREACSDDILGEQREVAYSQSLFSASLSLLVGLTVWEAKDPCMPLVLALFTVVGISLKSVVRLFSTIKNRPASEAVALLSFNWFILGTLTYPTLPTIARVVAPVFVNLLERVFRWFALLFIVP